MSSRRRSFSSSLILFLTAVLVCVSMAFFVCFLRDAIHNPTPEPLYTPSALAVDPNAGPRVTPEPAPTEPGIAIPGWTSITLPANAVEAPVTLLNPEDNEGWYYLTFELWIKETQEVVFTTGLIPPGEYCNQVQLKQSLEPGEYPCILHVQPYRMDHTPTNNADLDIRLVVE